jgi:hypothetical protein
MSHTIISEMRADEITRATRSAMADAATAEVVGALNEQGIRSILMRGPSISRLLYADGGERSYNDVDLLVAPESVDAAGQVLRGLGFTQRPVDPGELEHAEAWTRDHDTSVVDLHWTVIGVGADPSDLWRALAEATEGMTIRGARVEVLAREAIALQVALHAGQHGSDYSRALADLERALELLARSTWRAASELAERLRASELFAAGLRLLPAGEALAEELGLQERRSVETVLLTRSQGLGGHGAPTLERLSRTPGLRGRLSLVARSLFPPRASMHEWWPATQREGPWLVAGYLWRPFWVVFRAGPALLAWRQAVRDSRRAP